MHNCRFGDWDVAAVSVTAGTFATEDVAAETVVAVGPYGRRFNTDFLAAIYRGTILVPHPVFWASSYPMSPRRTSPGI